VPLPIQVAQTRERDRIHHLFASKSQSNAGDDARATANLDRFAGLFTGNKVLFIFNTVTDCE
jgi:hypothetical protein